MTISVGPAARFKAAALAEHGASAAISRSTNVIPDARMRPPGGTHWDFRAYGAHVTARARRGQEWGNFALTAPGDGDNVPPSFGPVRTASSKIALETCNGVASQLARRFSAGTRQGSKQRSVRTTLKPSPAKNMKRIARALFLSIA